MKLHLYTVKSGTAAPFTGMYTRCTFRQNYHCQIWDCCPVHGYVHTLYIQTELSLSNLGLLPRSRVCTHSVHSDRTITVKSGTAAPFTGTYTRCTFRQNYHCQIWDCCPVHGYVHTLYIKTELSLSNLGLLPRSRVRTHAVHSDRTITVKSGTAAPFTDMYTRCTFRQNYHCQIWDCCPVHGYVHTLYIKTELSP